MKMKNWAGAMALALLVGVVSSVRADDDARMISRLGVNAPKDQLRDASFYLVFNGNKVEDLPAVASGDETRFYSKVWDGLYLQVTTEAGADGTAGYMFSFSKDEDDQQLINTQESRDVATLREVTAADFRSDDNYSTRPLNPGPGTPSDRGALRVIHYEGFDVVIRVLEFKIGDISMKKKPYFKTLSVVVTVKETPAK